MSKIEEQSKSANTSEIRYLSPLDIDTAKVKKYCIIYWNNFLFYV